MSACTPFIQTIYPAECLSDSLVKINTNFANLQTKVCDIKETADSLVEVRTFWYYGPNAQNDPTSGMQSGVTSRPSNNTIKTFVNSQSQLNLPSISDNNDIAFVIFQKTGYFNTSTQGTVIGTTKTITGNPLNLQYNTWYNIRDYASAIASCDGAPGRLGTIGLTFRTEPNGQETSFRYRATGVGDDTYVEWNKNKVIYSEGYPIPKTKRAEFNTPYININAAQFRFTIAGNVFRKVLKGFPQITTPATSVVYKDILNQFAPTFFIWRLTYNGTEYTVTPGFPKINRAQGNIPPANQNSWNTPQLWTTY
jgi:hypothetical protein